MNDPRYPVAHPFTLALNREYDFTLTTGKVMTATYRGINGLGFWVLASGARTFALNPVHVVLFIGP